MARSVGTAEAGGQAGAPHGGGKPRRIPLGDLGHKDDGDARRPKHRKISRLAARIGGEILVRRELLWVDKDRRDDPVALGPSRPDQRQMALVQRPHRRYKADARAGFSPAGDLAPEIGNGTYDVQLTAPPFSIP